MENFNIESSPKIIEQLPEGVSMETFWKIVKLNEMKQGGNPQEPFRPGSLKNLKEEGLYTSKIISQSIEQIKNAKNLDKFLEEVNKEYKGGE
jgi:hypothetical protein